MPGANGYLGITIARQYGYIDAQGHAEGGLQADAEQTPQTVDLYNEERHATTVPLWVIAGAQAVSARCDLADRFLVNGDQSDAEMDWRRRARVRWSLAAAAQRPTPCTNDLRKLRIGAPWPLEEMSDGMIRDGHQLL